MEKPRVAVFDFACCEGCQLQIVNMEEEILDLISVIDPVEWREAMSEHSQDYEIAIVEGSITRPEDEVRVRQIRKRARIVVALGACATIGGVNKLKNSFDLDEVSKYVYGDAAEMAHLETAEAKAVDEVIKVDHKIHGCPMDSRELGYVIRCLVRGLKPNTPTYPVCVECKMRENVCCFEYDEVCLGPITRAGCNAACPSASAACFGCRGYVDDPNVNAARDVMDKYGKTVVDLKGKMVMFIPEQDENDGKDG